MNANKLKGKIIEKGLTMTKAAEMMGIHKTSLYRKVNGHDRLTVNDAVRLKEILGLSNMEALDIFLNQE